MEDLTKTASFFQKAIFYKYWSRLKRNFLIERTQWKKRKKRKPLVTTYIFFSRADVVWFGSLYASRYYTPIDGAGDRPTQRSHFVSHFGIQKKSGRNADTSRKVTFSLHPPPLPLVSFFLSN